MNDKFLSLLGMARRAGKTEFGYEKSLGSIYNKKAKAVFCACDLSEKTKRGLVFAAEDTNIDIITVKYSMFEMSNAVGLKTGIVTVTDFGFVRKLKSLLESSETDN